MSGYTAVLDANVLYSQPLTSLLLDLAEARLYRPVWSADIHEEWMQALARSRPDIDPAKIQRRKDAMDRALPAATVTGYRPLMATLQLPDPDDRHVLAVAIRAGAQAIVTFNVKDFPIDVLAEFDIEAQHPDAFLLYQVDIAPELVRALLLERISGYQHPPMSVADYIAMMARQRLPQTAAALRKLLDDHP